MADDRVETVAERVARERRIERVAVVFTHGQGEQAPMQDVTELADTVWTKVVRDRGVAGFKDQVWSVPVYDADMSEQRRLVTDIFRSKTGVSDLQVDFYQFYWADLMTGNRFAHLWLWFSNLMKRKAAQVPKPLMPIRTWAMVTAVTVGLIGLVFGLVATARLLVQDLWSWPIMWAGLMAVSLPRQVYALIRPSMWMQAFVGGIGLIIASLALGLARWPLLHGHTHLWSNAYLPPWLGERTWSGVISVIHSSLAAGLMILITLCIWPAVNLYRSFLVPVMADSARMLGGSPENLPARDKIRKRGMELLEGLHNAERRYDRIILVAHSLGTIVAYNVLSQYWGNVYRLMDHKQTAVERHAVETAAAALNETAARVGGPERREQMAEARKTYRQAVRAYFEALRRHPLPPEDVAWRSAEFTSPGQLIRNALRAVRGEAAKPADSRSPWLITDFITLGSPMTYAGLLMGEGSSDLANQFNTRRHPECPPDMDPDTGMVHSGRPHHAAVFAATCWTNIFFETEGLIRGDIIGGEVAGDITDGRFGWGPLDVAVRREPNMPEFAHNEYWRGYDAAEGGPAEHVRALRAAMGLFRDEKEGDESDLNDMAPPRRRERKIDAKADTQRAALVGQQG